MAPSDERGANEESVSSAASSGHHAEAADGREDLVRRVEASSTFEKSPKLRAFLHYVCRCAIENEPAAATEQQIGIHVFGRIPGYNPNEDNIVRSQARLLRLKLEHHFANEGKNEPLVITIPKGRYLPVFERRPEEKPLEVAATVPIESVAREPIRRRPAIVMLLLFLVPVLATAVLLILSVSLHSRESGSSAASGPSVRGDSKAIKSGGSSATVVPALPGEVRIAAGRTGDPYVDHWGHRWDPDRYYEGGVSGAGPQDLYPPLPDSNLFRTLREGAPTDSFRQPSATGFRYDIPVPPGIYELRLYFADPLRPKETDPEQGNQNLRHFQIRVNGRLLLTAFDAVADSSPFPTDIRAFKDISPDSDGKVHLEFQSAPERPILNALELTPGTPGKMKAIRVSVHRSEFVDADGTRWAGDNYFIGGSTTTYVNSGTAKLPALYEVERIGNFSYAIPVPQGRYTVKLHFLESFFNPLVPNGLCRDVGCRVFDVTCNGEMLLRDFDVFKAAGGPFRPVVRTFHGLTPNAQGKILLSFIPKINYAEVRAIEVIDEAP